MYSRIERSIIAILLFCCLISVTQLILILIDGGYGLAYYYICDIAFKDSWIQDIKDNYPFWWVLYLWNWLLFIGFIITLTYDKKLYKSIFKKLVK
ncbi:MAG: hypothetical protein ACFFDN_10845 [Candidatus Hodarchaeota archaeon]